MSKKAIISLSVVGILAVLVAAFFLFLPQMTFHMIFSKPPRSSKVPEYYTKTPHYKASQPGVKVLKSIPSEDVFITSRDGLRLHAYYYPAEQPSDKYVLAIHGYRSYARPEFGPFVDFYRSRGFNVLLPDDRGHGPSEGDYIGFGVLDRLDCIDWAKYLVKTHGEDIRIMLQGVSMGGATVVAASGEAELPSQVMGIVADCAFSDAYEVLEFQLKQMHMPVNYLMPRLEKICEKKAGFGFHEHTPKEQVKNARVPMLFAQGGKDDMVPPYMAQDLYDACGSEHKKLLMVPEAGHGESIAFAQAEYYQALEELFGL